MRVKQQRRPLRARADRHPQPAPGNPLDAAHGRCVASSHRGLRGSISRSKSPVCAARCPFFSNAACAEGCSASCPAIRNAARDEGCSARCLVLLCLRSHAELILAILARQAQPTGSGVARGRVRCCRNRALGRFSLFLSSFKSSRGNTSIRAQRSGKLWRHCHWARRDWLDHHSRQHD
jgi:hypothetical protein